MNKEPYIYTEDKTLIDMSLRYPYSLLDICNVYYACHSYSGTEEALRVVSLGYCSLQTIINLIRPPSLPLSYRSTVDVEGRVPSSFCKDCDELFKEFS